MVDTRKGCLGQRMDKVGPYVQLRAPGGGREWDADPEALRPASAREMRQAGVTEAPTNGAGTATRRAFTTGSGGIIQRPEGEPIPYPLVGDTSIKALEPVRRRGRLC
ncbi:hypothetical protein SMD11_1178 [Streptomyces albireticuli]|uniref:Uncharacterized protein n=1 Tax=Streptomyces albireticuli TaxID=1940 RepID=A0A1Z2KY19_9ACTN|nr:hypothetical protein SMD11_1178 [Streptomyces albireticuli]